MHEIEARASPRNPRVLMLVRSSYFCNFEVACRLHRRCRSSACIVRPGILPTWYCNRGKNSPSYQNSTIGDLRDAESWEIPELHGHCPVL